MFDLSGLLKETDALFKDRRPHEARDLLLKGLEKAAGESEPEAVLTILNELIGYYREFNQYDSCDTCIRQALILSDAMGIKGTVHYGTTLLNAATAYRAAGRLEDALRLYHEAADIFERELPPGDYRVASLYNNLSILYQWMGNLKQALTAGLRALALIKALGGNTSELATNHTNVALILLKLGETARALEHLEQAISLFTGEDSNSHYGAALAGLGEAFFQMRRFDSSIQAYTRALEEIEKYYGKNEYYETTRKNLNLVKAVSAALSSR